MADTAPEEERKRKAEPPPLEFVKPGEEPAPLPPRDQPPAAWVPRPEDFERRPQTWAPTPSQPAARRGGRAMVAGLCLILAGLIGMGETYLLLAQLPTPEDIANVANYTAADYATSAVLFLLLTFAQSAAVLGGIVAFQGKNWKFAVACGVLSLLSFGYLFVGSLLGLVGLLLILGARHEFTS